MRGGTNPWLIAIVVALAAFMEVLDTSIANVALPYMAGSLSATTEQSTWVLTSYLVSNAIVLPITGWFVSLLGRKRFFMICLAVFTLSSLLCGIAPSLGAMIVFRILQGAGGGGLQPMAQAILADTFPPQQRGLAFALFGITVVVAPDSRTHPGRLDHRQLRLALDLSDQPAGRHRGVAADLSSGGRPAVAEARSRAEEYESTTSAWRCSSSASGALQVMLDKGQELDWFSSRFIVTLAVLAAVGLVSLVVWEWFARRSDRRRAPVPESQLPQRQRDDVRGRHHDVFQPRDDAAVSAAAHGLLVRGGRPGAVGRRSPAADPDAHRRHAHDEGFRHATSSRPAGS